jgi:hypothetical protein
MGTSLNGLTPSATYSGLIKFGDNSAISASLKALSDGNGNDTILSISTTALQIGGSTGLFWDDTNKRLGVGTNAPSAKVFIQGTEASTTGTHLTVQGTGTAGFSFADYSGGNAYLAMYPSSVAPASRSFSNLILLSSASGNDVGLNSTTSLALKIAGVNKLGATNNGINIVDRLTVNSSSVDLSARAVIKGSGSTSATTSLLVQNSAGSNALQVRDDRVIIMAGLPTSSSGLPSGALWNNLGILSVA